MSSVADTIDQGIRRLATLGGATIGCGVKHPLNPQADLTDRLTMLLHHHPFLRRDEGYIAFLERYGGAMVLNKQESLALVLFGYTGVGLNLTDYDLPVTDNEGFFSFAYSQFRTDEARSRTSELTLGFAFDGTGNRKPGVYRDIVPYGHASDEPSHLWYCDGFCEWLESMFRSGGRDGYC